MYQLSDQSRSALEGLSMPLALFQNIGEQNIPLLVSDGFCSLLGIGREQLMEEQRGSKFDRIHPDDVGNMSQAVRRFWRKDGNYDVLYRIRCAGNTYHTIHSVAFWWTMEEGSELIVVISRAAVDAGADINEIFLINENFTANIEEFTNLEDLSAWVSNMLQRFISFTFEFDKVKHADAVYKVIEYIKTNFRRHMSLEDIAASTYLSKTYLSSLFKKETGYSISEYINIVRIDRSKSLLMEENMSIIEIANLCGFEDQSYFTKVFKHIVGITPKKYRENRGKNEKRDIILR